ncbi:TSL-kinase interacting protein 1 [Linum perenne]
MGRIVNLAGGAPFVRNSSVVYGCPSATLKWALPKRCSCFRNRLDFRRRLARFCLRGDLEVVEPVNSSFQHETGYCDEGESEDYFPHVQTLRCLPEEELSGKVVMVRFDSSIFLADEQLDKSLPSVSNALSMISYLLRTAGKLILVSGWKRKASSKLLDAQSFADILSSLLGHKVVALKTLSSGVPLKKELLEEADVFLLENLSGFKEEVANCPNFAKLLSSEVDVFVNDSFALSHRVLASTVGIARFAPASVAGYLFEDSLCQLKRVLDSNKRPYVAIVGGANILDKAAALRCLISKCDGLVFVGMMSLQILHALGYSIPSSLLEPGSSGVAVEVVQFAQRIKIPIIYPKDFWCISDRPGNQVEVVSASELVDGRVPVDLGPRTLDEIDSLLSSCKKVTWIGPVKFKSSHSCICKDGASQLAKKLDNLSQRNCEIAVVGSMACKAMIRESSSSLHYDTIENTAVVWEVLKGRKLPGMLALDRVILVLFAYTLCVLMTNFQLVRCCLDSVHQSGIPNGFFISTNATSTFRSIVSSYPGELALVSIQCPNPDFNDPEHRWRMLQRSLVEAVVHLLEYNGKVFLQSDIEAVALRMKDMFLRYSKGRLSVVAHELQENPFGVRSDWERHVLDRGAPIFMVMFHAVLMELEPSVSLGSDTPLHKDITVQGQDGPCVLSSTPDHVEPQQPVKKKTRQWAAWTRQEEESFFTALRHFGKACYWWSLLDKYSCKASKLHLKPRRFKIFLEALENQLLKDRKKNVRKQPSQGGTGSLIAASPVTSNSKSSAQATRMVKLVLIDGQNVQKLGSGVGTSASYRKWEREAIAGVSLVADAAEHLEGRAIFKEIDVHQAPKGPHHVDKAPILLPVSSHNQNVDSHVHNNMKLKLQFFPIDDITRKSLEMDMHNPHLELTLSARKKISSVLEHLNRKWGNSRVASGELMLLPYSIDRENLLSYQRWTQDSTVSAVDVYNSLGCPAIFRLRYGWFRDSGTASVLLQTPSKSSCIPSVDDIDPKTQDLVDTYRDQQDLINESSSPVSPSTELPIGISGHVTKDPKCNSLTASTNDLSCLTKDPNAGTNMKQLEDWDELRLSNGATLSAGEWADSLTNISVGDLLSEVPNDINTNGIAVPVARNDHCLQQIAFSCDSFDAAIAAHISKHQNKLGYPPLIQPQSSSIWDADETCDAFSFQKNHIPCQGVSTTSFATLSTAKEQELSNKEEQLDHSSDGVPMDEEEVMDNPGKDFSALADIYWPDSLGPLDMEIPSCKYHSEDIILSDSLGGLNRLIASSLDAFQNCSFLGLEKKDSGSTTLEARGSTSFSEFKVGSGV